MSVEMPKMASMSINGEIGVYIDITPEAASETWADIREVFENDTFAMNEIVQTIQFLADNGWGSSFVTGATPTVSATGRFFKNNQLCKYLLDNEYKIASHRVTRYKLEKFGKTITGSCTLQNINIGGGGGQDGAPMSITLGFNGEPNIEDTQSGGT